ncbi:MAG: DNA polymerase III subunit delta [Nocardioidaceae bacterium]
MADSSILGTVTLLSGKAEYLAEREVAEALAEVRTADADCDLTSVEAGDLASGSLAELTTPSLFARVRMVVIRGLSELPDDVQGQLLAYAADPAPDVVLVLLHPGGAKATSLLDRLRKLPAVRQVACEAPKPWELSAFVTAEVRRRSGQIAPDAAEFLAAAVGDDLRALAGAADQLVADFERERLTTSMVRRYFDGRAEVKSFDIADAAIEGRVALALEQLRWAMGNAVAPVLITSAFASGLRSLARLQAAPAGLRDGDLAREIGAQPFRLRALRNQLREWDATGLVSALQAVAQADLEVKGGAGDSDYALERMVLRVVRSRPRR